MWLLQDDFMHYYARDPFFTEHPQEPFLLTELALDTLRMAAQLRLALPRDAGQQSEAQTKGAGRRAPRSQYETLGAD